MTERTLLVCLHALHQRRVREWYRLSAASRLDLMSAIGAIKGEMSNIEPEYQMFRQAWNGGELSNA